MLYLATVHFRTPKWIDIQAEFIDRHISVPRRTFAVLDGIGAEHAAKFDRVIRARGTHEGRLNLLAAEITAEAEAEDIIIFLDGDAFPIADPMPAVTEALTRTSLLAVRRDENRGDRQPHPCFCAVTVGEWDRLHGDWSTGYEWEDSRGRTTSDVGGNLLGSLERSARPWTPLLRTNTRNDHPLWFGVYGDLVYHHGSGFRRPFSRIDEESRPPGLRGGGLPLVGPAIDAVSRRRRLAADETARRRSEAQSEEWFERICRDPEFYRPLIAR